METYPPNSSIPARFARLSAIGRAAKPVLFGAMLLLPALSILYAESGSSRPGAVPIAGFKATTTTVSSTGETAYTVPSGATALQVTLVGAPGGQTGTEPEPAGTSGEGAKVRATIPVPTGISTLYVEVGAPGTSGGLGGAGIGSSSGASGGGESDIQVCSVAGSCTYTANPSTDPRLLVAGGGGGAGEDGAAGGSAGTDVGGSGGDAGTSTTVTGPGSGGAGSDVVGANAGGNAGVGNTTTTAAVGDGAVLSTLCGAAGDGDAGTPGHGGNGGTCDALSDSGGGGGGGGWVGGSGGGAGNVTDAVGDGGGGGAGASYTEGSATDVTIASAGSTTPEVVITAIVPARPSFASSGQSPTFKTGSYGSTTITATGEPTPTLTESGALPIGVTFHDNGDGTATLLGTPAAGTGGVYPFTVTAFNGVNPPATAHYVLTVDPVPTISSLPNAAFTVGDAGSFTVRTAGYQEYMPTISSSGSLPRGVTFHNNGNGTATLSGTPASGTGGSYPVALTASNGRSPALHGALVLNVATPGYVAVTAAGGAYAYGGAKFSGSEAGHKLNAPVVGVAETPDGKGYWMVASDGGVFAFGDAKFYGSMGGRHLNKPIVGMQSTPNGKGYWLVASDGGVFTFGDATFYGSTGNRKLNKPVVGMTPTPSGKGYWLVASDGGIFAFGNAPFHGSTGAMKLDKPIVGMAVDPSTNGYWLVGSDGGVFCFDAPYVGRSTGNADIVGVTSNSATGYLLIGSDGSVYAEGKVPDFGSIDGRTLNAPIVAIASPEGT
jgi:hypothetical protein